MAVAVASLLAGGVVAAATVRDDGTDRDGTGIIRTAAVPAAAKVRGASEVPPPTRVRLPELGVDAPIRPVGDDTTGAVVVPAEDGIAGWYERLEAPGQVGTAILVGHLDSQSGPAVFFLVPRLRPGAEVLVDREDGSIVRFVVDRVEQHDKRRFPTFAVYGPSDRPRLRLITCGGPFDDERREYRDNVVVYATAEETA